MMWRTEAVMFVAPAGASTRPSNGILNVLLIEAESGEAHFFELRLADVAGK